MAASEEIESCVVAVVQRAGAEAVVGDGAVGYVAVAVVTGGTSDEMRMSGLDGRDQGENFGHKLHWLE